MQDRDIESGGSAGRESKAVRRQTMDANRRGSISPRLPKVKGVTEVGQQLTQQLQYRIYTSSSKKENPHFTLGKRKGGGDKLAPISMVGQPVRNR